jgi:thiamine-phosphate pyrophosphorylase
MKKYSRIQYISSGDTVKEQYINIVKILEAGGDWIQLRWKKKPDADFRVLASQLSELKKSYDFTYIINDHVSIALQVNADGVHLGLDDLNIKQARLSLGPDKIIGGTRNTKEHVLQRITEGCNYIGLGPCHFTTSKQKLSPILGYEGYAAILNSLGDKSDIPPIYAIGGISTIDLKPLSSLGIYGIAVSALLSQHESPQCLLQQINLHYNG